MASDGYKHLYIRQRKNNYDYENKNMSQMFRNEIISSVSGTTILDEGPANFPAVSLTDDGEVIYYKNPGHKMRLWIDKESFEEAGIVYGYIQNVYIGTRDKWMYGHNDIDESAHTIAFTGEDWFYEFPEDADGNSAITIFQNSESDELRIYIDNDIYGLGWCPYVEDMDGNELPLCCNFVSEFYSPQYTILGSFIYIQIMLTPEIVSGHDVLKIKLRELGENEQCGCNEEP